MKSIRSNEEMEIRKRIRILFRIPYSAQIGNRKYWNYVNNI